MTAVLLILVAFVVWLLLRELLAHTGSGVFAGEWVTDVAVRRRPQLGDRDYRRRLTFLARLATFDDDLVRQALLDLGPYIDEESMGRDEAIRVMEQRFDALDELKRLRSGIA